MDKDLSDQLERVEELIGELETELNKNLYAKEISGRGKNITQEVVEKLSNILDQVARKLWSKCVLSDLTEEEKKKARVYFPVGKDLSSFNSILGRALKDFKEKYPEL